MIKAVIFDVDRTLTKSDAFWEVTTALGGNAAENISIYQDWKNGTITEAEVKRKLIANWSRNGIPTKKKFQKILDAIPLREDAHATIEYLQSKGYKTCLITGSYDLYGELVAKKLGVSDWYALTKLSWDGNGNLLDLETYHTGKFEKAKRLQRYCDAHGIEPKECIAVGDSGNDIELFRLTGRGIAVRTEFEGNGIEPVSPSDLERAAWKVITHLAELRVIL